MRLLFDPNGLRPYVVNWEEIAAAMLQRLRRDLATAPNDEECRALRDELLATEGIHSNRRLPDYALEAPAILSMRLEKDDLRLDLFSTITTMDTPLDITLQELRVDTFLPADAQTERAIRALSASE